jgi:N-acetylmuramoyl-L-alanine amidase
MRNLLILLFFCLLVFDCSTQDNLKSSSMSAANSLKKATDRLKVSKSENVIRIRSNKDIICIAVDPGFGGSETGPSGCHKDIFAKDINLAISKKIVSKIKSDLEIDAFLTRESDKFVSLEERTAIANTKNAELFISVQVNGYSDPKANGMETYYLNWVADNEALKMATANNTSKPKDLHDMDMILKDLMQNSKISESNLLANSVQSCLYRQLKEHNREIKNRGTKQAPFYVLLGAQMPAIVVNPGFITNPIECKLLSSKEYQEEISSGVVEGIRTFLKKRNTQPLPSADR